MKKSTKIWLAIIGILLIVLGVVCICKPAATLFTAAWLIGVLTLLTGISKLVFTCKTQAYLPNSGTRMLSGVLLVILGIIFLGHKLFLAFSLPVIFAMWVLIEGIMIAVQSFDYKKAGFAAWWSILLLGIAGAVLGICCLKNPDVSVKTLTLMIGIGIIFLGVAHLVALRGVKQVEKFQKAIVADE